MRRIRLQLTVVVSLIAHRLTPFFLALSVKYHESTFGAMTHSQLLSFARVSVLQSVSEFQPYKTTMTTAHHDQPKLVWILPRKSVVSTIISACGSLVSRRQCAAHADDITPTRRCRRHKRCPVRPEGEHTIHIHTLCAYQTQSLYHNQQQQQAHIIKTIAFSTPSRPRRTRSVLSINDIIMSCVVAARDLLMLGGWLRMSG